MSSNDFFNQLQTFGVLPAIVIDSVADAEPLAEALIEGGLPLVEITLRTDAALEAIHLLNKIDGLLVGAGTVLNIDHMRSAIAAGAKFLVSPGLDAEMVNECQKEVVPLIPGIATASEAQEANNLGLRHVKFFPAGQLGGVKTINALSAVFRDMRFLPTGGVSENNLAEYLACSAIDAVGGSWIAPASLIAKSDYNEITNRARSAVEIVRAIRGKYS